MHFPASQLCLLILCPFVLYCTWGLFHFHYKALPFSLLVSFICFLVIYTSSHVPNLFYTPNFCGAKNERKCMQKRNKQRTFLGLIKDFLQHRMDTDAHCSQTAVTVCLCYSHKLLSSTKDSGFFGGYCFAFFFIGISVNTI